MRFPDKSAALCVFKGVTVASSSTTGEQIIFSRNGPCAFPRARISRTRMFSLRKCVVLSILSALLGAVTLSSRALAGDAILEAKSADAQRWLLNFQSTFILQGQPGLRSPYEGANSLPSGDTLRETFSFDICAGLRPWAGAEIYFQPEYYQGFGFHSNIKSRN